MLRGTAIVSVLTLLSRILGFVRDLLVARLLGASVIADSFFVAFRIPNLLRSFVAEGALTSAFVPVFAQSLAKSKEDAADTFRRIAGFLLTLTLPLTCLGIVFAPTIVQLFAPGFTESPDQFALTVLLTQLMMPYIVCVSFIAMLNSALNALGIFGASAWAQVTMNLVLIAGALVALPFAPESAVIILALSVVVGGIAQIVSQLPTARRAALPLTPEWGRRSEDVREVVRLMLPATVGASVYQLTIFFATLLASLLQEGSVSWLFYADRVAQFPIGIFSVALASVLLPTLANASAAKDLSTFRSNMGDSLRYSSFIVLPMATGIWVLALPITELLFERGAFTRESSIMTSKALQALALGLWFASCHSMIVRAFIARKDTITPTLIGVASLTTSVLCSLVLMGPVERAGSGAFASIASNVQLFLGQFILLQDYGHVGLALASSIAGAASLTLAALTFTGRVGGFPWRPYLSSSVRSIVASAVMGAAVWWFASQAPSALVACVGGTAIGAMVYAVASFLLGSTESRETVRIAKHVLHKALRAKS